ncbi:hypothetical protein TCSYLVIO_006289 [Trypanosoma cruzi]|nr:hypothetical protein TCSYLVIO_006289 [Trypanosoma cruzi]
MHMYTFTASGFFHLQSKRMVLSASHQSSTERPYLSFLTKPQNQSYVERGDDLHVHWSSSSSQLDDALGSSAFGEEGLTQSTSSENDESDDANEPALNAYGLSLTQDSYDERSPFEELYESLRTTSSNLHPFFDMNEQRLMVENERMQRHYELFLSMGQKNAPPLNVLSILSKSLLNEAHRVHVSLVRRYNKKCHEKALPLKNEREINRQWQHIKLAVEQDLYMEGFVAVQRRLSCMCIFNPDTDERLYGDNENARQQRLLRQKCVLDHLAAQTREGGGLFYSPELQRT